MKKLTAFLLACSCVASLCACGNEAETSDSYETLEFSASVPETAEEKTDTSDGTAAESETEEETADAETADTAESEKPDTDNTAEDNVAEDNIALNAASGVMVAETGNYETYLDNFSFPEKYIVHAEGENGYTMAVGTDGSSVMFRIAFPVTADKSEESGFIDYAFYETGSDAYSVMNIQTEEKTESKVQHIVVQELSNAEEFSDNFSYFDWSRSGLVYKDYSGEQEWNGTVYDTISAEMTLEDNTVPAVFWFSKEGEFVKADFSSEGDNSTGYIQAVSEITLPDMSDMEIEEANEEDFGTTLFNVIMMSALYAASQSSEAKYPLTEGQIAEYGTAETTEFQTNGYSLIGGIVHVYGESIEAENGTYSSADYVFNNVKEGKQVMEWYSNKDTFDEMYLTVECVPTGENEYLITKVIEHRIETDE